MQCKFLKKICPAVLCLALAGCGQTIRNYVAPGVDNETKVAYGTSTVNNPDYPHQFVVKAAPELSGKPCCNDALRYTENGLAALGMTRLETENADSLVVTVNYSMNNDSTHSCFEFVMQATAGNHPAWSVRTFCFGDAEKIGNYLPGLVAGALPLVGTNRKAAINLNIYQSYLEAVMGEYVSLAKQAEPAPAAKPQDK